MFLRGIYQLVLVLLFVVPSSTLYGATLPEFYGVYIKDNGKYYEGKPASKGSSGDFSGSIRVLIFDKIVLTAGSEYTLYKLMFARNKITKQPGGRSRAKVSALNRWYWSTNHPIDTRIKPVKGEPEMVYMVPRKPLPPGFYAIGMGTQNWIASFYIDKARMPNDLSKSDMCIDIQASYGFLLLPGEVKGKEVPCGQSGVGSTKKSSKIDKKMEALLRLRVASKNEYYQFIEDEKKRSAAVLGLSEWIRTNRSRKRANAAYQSRDYKNAIKIYREILQNDSKDWWAHAVLGDCYIETGKLDKGLKHISTAIRKLPADFLFAIVYKAYAAKGNMPTALVSLEKALKAGYTLSGKDARDILNKANNDTRLRRLLENYRVKVAS